MSGTTYFSNQFLIAMPGMGDPNFQQTVTFICEHSDDGAMGIIINRPLDVMLSEIFEQLSLSGTEDVVSDQMVMHGGPVQQERGFVIHTPGGEWDSTLDVSETVRVTTSRDILTAMAQGDGPERALVALGYAGWHAGQLEQEISANAWLNAPANDSIIFEIPVDKRWQAAADLLGVDLRTLSHDAGHA